MIPGAGTVRRLFSPEARIPRWLSGPIHAASKYFVVGLGTAVYLLALPVGWFRTTPLPWDCSWHLLGATRIASTLHEFRLNDFRHELLAADQYPPMHSLVLGSWLATVGSSVQSWLLFGLVVYLGTLALLAKSTRLGAALLIGSPMLGALAPSLMVDSLAVLWVVLAFVWFESMCRRASCDIRHGLVLGLILCGGLLTKYNVGLPMLVCFPLAAIATRRMDLIRASLVGVAGAAAICALFITAQTNGWQSVEQFARNRANSTEMNALERFVRYALLYKDLFVGSSVLAILVVTLTFLGVRKRDPAWLAGILYVSGAMLALSLHPYILGRNLVGPFAALVFTAGVAIRHLRFGRLVAGAVGTLAIALALSGLPDRRDGVARYYPERSRLLTDLSGELRNRMLTGPYPKLVVGSFNELGPNWIFLISDQDGVADRVRVDVPYPMERSRTGLSPDWNEAYIEVAREIADSSIREVLAIRVSESSPFWTSDYEHWNAWKNQVSTALERSGEFQSTSMHFESIGIDLVEFTR